jgi:hypothetical protein
VTVNAVRRRTKVPKIIDDAPPQPMAIGEIDANIVDCPVCKRPLDTSARRCPGCRTRFLAGVQLSKASVFLAVGLGVGLMAGGGVVALTVPRTVPAPLPTAVPSATVAPVPTAGTLPTPPPTAVPVNPGVPAAATAALRGTTTINARIISVTAPLAGVLTAPDFDAQEVARVMRRMTGEATAALTLVPSLGAWPEAAPLQSDLTTFYGDLRSIATETLASSVRNEAAYRAGARAMVDRVATLATFDRASRDLAATVGLELPAIDALP